MYHILISIHAVAEVVGHDPSTCHMIKVYYNPSLLQSYSKNDDSAPNLLCEQVSLTNMVKQLNQMYWDNKNIAIPLPSSFFTISLATSTSATFGSLKQPHKILQERQSLKV